MKDASASDYSTSGKHKTSIADRAVYQKSLKELSDTDARTSELAGGAAGPAGSVGSAIPGSAPDAKDQKTHLDAVSATADSSAETAKHIESMSEKGIKFDKSKLKADVSPVLKSATLDSFRKALLENALFEVKLRSNSGLEKEISENSDKILNSGAGASDFLGIGQTDNVHDAVAKVMKDASTSHASGIMNVPYDGYMASLHRGERVVPAADVRTSGMSSRSTGGNVTTVHISGAMDPREIARQVARIQGAE